MKYNRLWSLMKVIIVPIFVSIFVFYIVLNPKEIIDATKDGIYIWFNSVLPSLLPFIIGIEILYGLGVVNFIGTLIEPLVRPLFRVPGEASFVFAMSITSGYPIGVKLTTDLRKKGIISRDEAQRMISFCSTSGPLFIIGAVSVGMFQNEAIGPLIVIAHYVSALLVGLAFRNYGKNNRYLYSGYNTTQNIIKKAFNNMLKAKKDDGRGFGKLLGDSVREAISTQLLIGGIIVLFSVIIKEITLLGFIDFLEIFFDNLIPNSGRIIRVLFTGFIEITLGCKMVSESILNPLLQVILVTMIISWSGLSVHAQSASFINDTDINTSLYILSKLLHSIISGIIVFLFFVVNPQNYYVDVFNSTTDVIFKYSWFQKLFFSTELFLIITLSLMIFGIIYYLLKN